uniref:Secreted protein n=1 Tax=Achlya hypogyna TaxID=1202772 RepID=A0A0A7CNY7_ACHHY|nr:secreted protein [Achlya hypogyna]
MAGALLHLAASAIAAPAAKPVSDLAERFGFNTTAENADNRREYDADFTNFALHPGWGEFEGPRGCTGRHGSRMRFDWDLAGGEAVSYVAVTLRGAPDTGKNSYAILREPKCQEDLKKHNCDEIDMAELWGCHQIVDAHSFLYNPALDDYAYATSTPVFQVTTNANNQNHTTGFNDQDMGGGWPQGPSAHPMRLYFGIWDCSTEFGSACGPHFGQHSFMDVKSVWVKQCW